MKALSDDLSRVECFLRYVILWGANDVRVEMDNKQISSIRFGFPGGAAGEVIMRDRQPARGALQVVRGRELARTLEREHLCERCRKRMATVMFDCSPVCSPCRRTLERKLTENG